VKSDPTSTNAKMYWRCVISIRGMVFAQTRNYFLSTECQRNNANRSVIICKVQFYITRTEVCSTLKNEEINIRIIILKLYFMVGNW